MKNLHPYHAINRTDRVSPAVRSLQGDNNGLTYRQECALRTMARKKLDKLCGSRVLTAEEAEELHADIAVAASKSFGREVSSQQVKLALKAMRHLKAGASKGSYPIDAGFDAYAFIAYVAEAEGMTLKDTLGVMVIAFRQDWHPPA
jgi:hypothetical protein